MGDKSGCRANTGGEQLRRMETGLTFCTAFDAFNGSGWREKEQAVHVAYHLWPIKLSFVRYVYLINLLTLSMLLFPIPARDLKLAFQKKQVTERNGVDHVHNEHDRPAIKIAQPFFVHTSNT